MGCNSNQFLFENEQNCFDNCNYYDFKKNNRCVNNENDKSCPKYYYEDENRGVYVCLKEDENDCENRIGFQYLIEEEKRCYEECNGVLSLDGVKCNKNLSYECREQFSSNKSKNGKKQCFCDYKYYYENSANQENHI